MFRLKLVPEKTNVPFIGMRKIAIAMSALLMIASVVTYVVRDLNFGIDFRGGTLIEVGAENAIDIGAMRSTLGGLGLGDVQIQEFGAANDVLIRIEQQEGGDQTQQDVVKQVQIVLNETFTDLDYRRVEVVGPKVSGELIEAGIFAVLAAVFAVLFYIWIRFEWQFSLGAVIALVHDVTLTIGVFSLLQLEFNLSIIAAILTIVGYSLNDTVVVYDRVRENLRKYKKRDLSDLLDLSLNETLSRTTMTSVTTLLALISLYVFGGEVIRGFTFAMIWGVVVGTYSSIFVASPILLILGVKRDWSKVSNEAGANANNNGSQV